MKEVRLGNICAMQSGGTPRRGNDDYYGGEILWVKIGDIDKAQGKPITNTTEKITEKGLASINNRIFKEGTLLLAMYGSVGKTAFAGTKLSTNQAILGINVNDEKILNISYLKRWFDFNRIKILNGARGATLQNISATIVKNFKIPLPPLPEQKRIATILDKAGALHQKNKQLLDAYDDLLQATFLDMFGDPVTNPKKWETKNLGTFGDWKSGGTPLRSIKEYYEGDIPWLSSGELENMYVSNSNEFINEKAIAESAAKKIEIGSLMLGMYDTAALKSSINTRILTCNQAIAFAKLDEKKINTLFAYTQIQMGKEFFRSKQRGVRQKNLNLSMIKSLNLIYPPIRLQNKFAQIVENIDAQKAIIKQSMQESEDLFNGLVQKAFKGELNEQ